MEATEGLYTAETLQDHFKNYKEEGIEVIGASNTSGISSNTKLNNTCAGNCIIFGLLRNRPQQVLIALGMLLTLLLFLCSCLTILVIRRNDKLKERRSSTFVTNLAVAGGLIGMLVCVSSLVLYMQKLSPRGVAICLVVLPRVLHAITALNLACLTLDRYLALCWPLRYHALLTDTRCIQLVLMSWLLPTVILGIACFIGKALSKCPDVRPYLITYLLFFMFAIGAVVAMYFLIAREFRRPLGSAVGGEEMAKVRRRTARELMVVVLVNLLLATPDVIMKLYLLTCPKTLPVLYDVAPLLLLVHLLCFYPLYAWKNSDYRRACKDFCISLKISCVILFSWICQPSFLRDSFARISLTSVSSGRTSSGTTTTLVAPTTPTAEEVINVSMSNAEEKGSSASPSSTSSTSSSRTAGQDNVIFQL